MTKEFVDFISELFPSISPYTKERVKYALDQFDKDELEWFMPSHLDKLSQGDIIEKLPFTFCDDNGNKNTIILKGMVLSTNCDIDNDDNIIIAPLFQSNSALKRRDSLITLHKNKYYDKMCFPNSQIDDYFVDFTLSSTFNKKVIEKLLDAKTKVEYSLNMYGHFLLITKLTVYYLRPEDIETRDARTQ